MIRFKRIIGPKNFIVARCEVLAKIKIDGNYLFLKLDTICHSLLLGGLEDNVRTETDKHGCVLVLGTYS
jgi:hypothetical protein